MNILLFGFKGCGKTHFGNLLAQKMHRRFIDTDNLVMEYFAKQVGKHILLREIYVQLGFDAFRTLEKKTLQSLTHTKDTVIALGGGAVLDPKNIKSLQKIGCLVYLSTSAQTLQQRVLKHQIPAFLDAKNPQMSFLKMYQERRPIYESISADKIDCDILDEAGILAALQSLLIRQDPPNTLLRKQP